jgi:predicted hydrocarbon binding protein
MTKLTEKWVTSIMACMDTNVDEKTRIKILEECGRNCQSPRLVKKAKAVYKSSKGVDDFIDKFSQVYKQLHREGSKVYVVYPRCFCSQVNKIAPGKLSATYCNCGRGWVKALFEGALDRPVDVLAEKTVIRGDKECRFRIVL